MARSNVDHDESILLSVVEAGLQELPKLVTALNEAMGTRDAPTAKRSAHTIKSIAGTFGVTALHQCALVIESNAEAEKFGSESELRPEMERLCEQVLSELKQHQALPDS